MRKNFLIGGLVGFLLLFCSFPARGAVPPDLQKKIDRSIKKGRKFLYAELRDFLNNKPLRKKVGPRGMRRGGMRTSYPQGVLALHLYALFKTGASPRDPLIRRAFAKMSAMRFQKTYSVALALLAFYTAILKLNHHPPSKKTGKRKTVLRKRKKKIRLSPKQFQFAQRAVKWLLRSSSAKALGGWGYGGGYSAGSRSGDNSNTQFALLGLWAGQKLGVRIPSIYWQNILAMYLRTSIYVPKQGRPITWSPFTKDSSSRRSTTLRPRTYKKGRGWGYTTYVTSEGRTNSRKKAFRKMRPTTTMTIAGICGTLISSQALGRLHRKDILRPLGQGLAYMAYTFALPARMQYRNPYYLYSMERLGAFTRLDVFGKIEWYPFYAKQVVAYQSADGSIGVSYSPVISTCLYLLFLTRATQQFFQPKKPARIVTGSGVIHRPKKPTKTPKKPRVVSGGVISHPKNPLPPKIGPGKTMAPKVSVLKGISLVQKILILAQNGKAPSASEKRRFNTALLGLTEREQIDQVASLAFLLNRSLSIQQWAHGNLVKIFGMDFGPKSSDCLRGLLMYRKLKNRKTPLQKVKKILKNPYYKGRLFAQALLVMEETGDLSLVGWLLPLMDQFSKPKKTRVLALLKKWTGTKKTFATHQEAFDFYKQWWEDHNKQIYLKELIPQFIAQLNSPDPQLQKRAYRLLLAIGKPALPLLNQAKKSPEIRELIKKIGSI